MLILAHGTRPDQSPWAWDPHFDVVVVLALLTAAYVGAIRRVCPQLVGPGEPLLSPRLLALVTTAIGALWVFSLWPIHNLAEGFSYTVHMVQHSVFTLVVPPLLILGTPAWLRRWALNPVLPVFRRLTRPVVAVVVFSVVATVTHLPVLADGAVSSGLSHFAQHALLFVAAVLVWWPLTSPLDELPRLRAPRLKMLRRVEPSPAH